MNTTNPDIVLYCVSKAEIYVLYSVEIKFLFHCILYRVYKKKLNKFEIALNVAKRLKV